MLTVEIGLKENGEAKEVVEVYFDKEGLDDLQARLSLIEKGETDHIHLMSETWGLGDLSEEKQREGNLLAHHLRLTLVS